MLPSGCVRLCWRAGCPTTLNLFQTLAHRDQSGNHQPRAEIAMKQWKILNELSDKINSVCQNEAP